MADNDSLSLVLIYLSYFNSGITLNRGLIKISLTEDLFLIIFRKNIVIC
jgi:hypothetical protein